MAIGTAIEALKSGKMVYRRIWKDVILDMITVGDKPLIVMRIPGGNMIPWLVSQDDILAEDWRVIGHGDN